jgi:hypothetical protein
MKAKRPVANRNRGKRDSGRNDPVPIALWLLLTDLPHIPHGYCIGPGFGWISFASIKVRSTNVLNNFGNLFLSIFPKCKQKESMNQTLHNGQTGQPTPIINNQVDDMNTSNIPLHTVSFCTALITPPPSWPFLHVLSLRTISYRS